MKVHTTNYSNTLITVAADCPVKASTIPAKKEHNKSIAEMQFELLYDFPYQYRSDDILFSVNTARRGIIGAEVAGAKADFFSKGQACFRASPLTKRYGWGVHFDKECKMALIPMESEEYEKMTADSAIKKVAAMRTKRK